MCLTVDRAATATLAAKLAAAGSLIAYKVLLLKEGKLYSPLVGAPNCLLYGPGRTQAKGQRSRGRRYIRGGALHVFLTRSRARSFGRSLNIYEGLRVVQVCVEAKDFLGASVACERAAFHALTISKRSHAQALRGAGQSLFG